MVWMPSGLLAFLPLHAAGIYQSSDAASNTGATDFVISSYTPSLGVLLRAKTDVPGGLPKVAVITQPDSSPPLPGTLKEAATIEHIGQSRVYHLSGAEATPDTVFDAIAAHDWVHLACHGCQDVDDPTKSFFALHDGSLSLSRVMGANLNSAQLAFLSACQTATGNKELPSEAIHLTAGMLAAGFTSVVGTMWSIGDSDAPIVAEAFYSILWKQGVDLGWKRADAASALHEAVLELRRNVGDSNLVKWVPFVHFGC